MPRYKVKYRPIPTSPKYETREVEADSVNRGGDLVTFVDANGLVWQVDANLVAEVERIDE